MWLPRPLQLMQCLLVRPSYSLGACSNCNIWHLGNTISKGNTGITGNTSSTGVADDTAF